MSSLWEQGRQTAPATKTPRDQWWRKPRHLGKGLLFSEEHTELEPLGGSHCTAKARIVKRNIVKQQLTGDSNILGFLGTEHYALIGGFDVEKKSQVYLKSNFNCKNNHTEF